MSGGATYSVVVSTRPMLLKARRGGVDVTTTTRYYPRHRLGLGGTNASGLRMSGGSWVVRIIFGNILWARELRSIPSYLANTQATQPPRLHF
ncbi:hypothetical protein BV22DRAFT_1132555 [Leucogyrophana mollusca]|uniref:Uncharacterized protein n=1 Tax=Leucogyrophana mollusca TaxID=85980 RepID=A0ACB8B6F3_9AGAM|nr:hypothetical protein BV22DRAFT_1132555 [Leucogyrophana mollusca]